MKNLKIELSLPFSAEYVSVAKLTVSGIAGRMGFDIETIEDIKVAVSEVCNKFVTFEERTEHNYNITFNITETGLHITFISDNIRLLDAFSQDDELGISIIKALVDTVDIENKDGFRLKMTKNLILL